MTALAGESGHRLRVARLLRSLRELPALRVAYSGGVDSSVLLHAASRSVRGPVTAVVADSPSLPRNELADALDQAARWGIAVEVVRTTELEDPSYRANAGDRCYYCKSALFDAMKALEGVSDGACPLAFGEIVDDLSDDRPGALAAAERGVLAPLSAAGMTKVDVREYARSQGLGVSEKPAAACLASRIPRGTRVTRERLARVEEAENRMRARGIEGVLRVRDRGAEARLEVEEARFEGVSSRRADLATDLLDLGFATLEIGVYGAS